MGGTTGPPGAHSSPGTFKLFFKTLCVYGGDYLFLDLGVQNYF